MRSTVWLDLLCVNQGWLHQLRTRLASPTMRRRCC